MQEIVTLEMTVNDLSAVRAALGGYIYRKHKSQFEYEKRNTAMGDMLARACQNEIDVAEALLERVIKKEDEFYFQQEKCESCGVTQPPRECPCMDPWT